MEKTILLVEDQLEFRAVQSMYLQHHGYRVLTAGDGDTALQLAQAYEPELIIIDYSLPGMDGIRTVEHLKQSPATGHIPVVMLTAISYGAVGRRAREAGCDAFLSKPVEPRRLLEEVQRRIG